MMIAISPHKLIRNRNQSGDTIIEVLISMAILALVLSVTFTSSSNSLKQGTEANNRQKATSLAQQEIEYIRNAEYSVPVALDVYKGKQSPGIGPNVPFCIDPAAVGTPPAYGQLGASTGTCQDFNGNTGFHMSITYDDVKKVFTVVPSWPGPANQAAYLTFYYSDAPAVSFTPSLTVSLSPVVPPGDPPTCTTPTTVGGIPGFLVPNNTQCMLSWTTTSANGCTPNTANGDTQWNSYIIFPLDKGTTLLSLKQDFKGGSQLKYDLTCSSAKGDIQTKSVYFFKA